MKASDYNGDMEKDGYRIEYLTGVSDEIVMFIHYDITKKKERDVDNAVSNHIHRAQGKFHEFQRVFLGSSMLKLKIIVDGIGLDSINQLNGTVW